MRERLHGAARPGPHAAPQRKPDAGQHQHRRDIQSVKEQLRDGLSADGNSPAGKPNR